MPNDGTGVSWDEAHPADLDPRRDGAKEIRDLRIGVADRLAKEHVEPAGSSAGGEHISGSAKVYYVNVEPSHRPDTTTVLDLDDAGRLWVNFGSVLKYFNGTDWHYIQLTADSIPNQLIDNAMLEDLIISADADGRRLIDDEFFDTATLNRLFAPNIFAAGNTTTVALFQDNFWDNGAIAKFKDGLFAADATSRAKFGDGIWTAAKLASLSRVQYKSYVGDGTTSRDIGADFDPVAIVVFPVGTSHINFALKAAASTNSVLRSNGGSDVTNCIDFGTAKFTIKSASAEINANATTYVVLIFG